MTDNKKIKIALIVYIIITLTTLFIATNSNIIVEQRICILTATYFIRMIAGLLAGFIGFTEEDEENDSR